MAPGILIAVMWASTLAVSAYWAHPSVLLGFPPSEIAWMIISPLALVAMVTGAAQSAAAPRLLGPAAQIHPLRGQAASLGLGLFLLGNLIWLVDGGPGPNNQFRAGTVNLVGLAVMILTLALAIQSIRRAGSPRDHRWCGGRRRSTNPMTVAAVVFDLDGVLLDSEQLWDRARRESWPSTQERGPRVPRRPCRV